MLGDEGGDMLVGLSPCDLPLRWEDMMQNGLETRLHESNFDFEEAANRGCRQNLRRRWCCAGVE